jgi:hypothetical protein
VPPNPYLGRCKRCHGRILKSQERLDLGELGTGRTDWWECSRCEHVICTDDIYGNDVHTVPSAPPAYSDVKVAEMLAEKDGAAFSKVIAAHSW